MENKNSSSGGIGVVGLLGVAFVVLKLCGVINWSWWWVTLPFWGGIALFILGIGIYLLYEWRKSVDTKKRLAAGMNEWAWKRRKKNKNIEDANVVDPTKTKWQQRMDEMKEAQKRMK